MTLADLGGVFDIECAEWDRFVCGGIVDSAGHSFMSWDEREYAGELLSREGVYYAHAGGRYDMLWLLDFCVRSNIAVTEVKPRGSGIMSMKIGDLELRDSYALVPMALAKCAAIGEQEKSSLSLPCECGEECGGYCALARPLSARERRLVESYQLQDCVALRAMLLGLSARCEALNITPGLTVGGTAWSTAKRWCDLPACSHDLGRYDALSRGASGGMTIPFMSRAPAGERYDIHSSYPAALSVVALPWGTPRLVTGSRAGMVYRAGAPGIYRALVHVPDCHIPPLAARETDRLLYPIGPIDGAWTAIDLQHAEQCGAKILKIKSGYVWKGTRVALKDFAERGWAIRDQNARACTCTKAARRKCADRKCPGCLLCTCPECAFAAWIKWFINSATGKFKQNPDHETLTWIPAIDGAPILGHDARVLAVNDRGAWVVTESRKVDACAHVEWYAYLTAYARIELHSQLLHAGESAIYCDTDSVYSTRALTRRLGPNLGEWGHEGSLADWRCLAPKVYRYVDPITGKSNVRGKGMSGLTSEGFDGLADGKSWVVDRGVDGLKTALRSHSESLFRRKSLARSLSPVRGWIGGRVIEGDMTRPPTVAEYRERET